MVYNVFNRVIIDPSFVNIMVLINYLLTLLFTLIYFHHTVYLLVGPFLKEKLYPDAKINHKYGYIICAHNEEKVIAYLIQSINRQTYPKELIKVFVCADNCTDRTADIARENGAIVFVRNNSQFVGKSYALDFAFKKILKDYQKESIEGYFVFDADNLVDANYTYEMNKAFDAGYKICTSFRNTKNFDDGWIASGSGIMFYREARLTHRFKSQMNMGTYVSGTGFLVSEDIIRHNKGWIYHLLIEDIEFSIDMLNNKQKVAYVEKAKFYDEQSKRLKESWNQRLRWCKGTHQCFQHYESKLLKNFFKTGDFTYYDLATHILPFPMIIFIWNIFYPLIIGVYSLIVSESFDFFYQYGLLQFINGIIISYLYLFITGLIVVICVYKQIKAKWYNKILSCFTFPLYMYLYLPITTIAAFKRVEWKKIDHNISISIEDMMKKE